MSSTTSTSCWAFDLDGVLVNSRPAVEAAYQRAGVTMPSYAWGVSWREWLPAVTDDPVRVHSEKQQHYLEMVERGDVPELPGAALARALQATDQCVYVVTSASNVAASVLVRKIGLSFDVFTQSLKHTELTRTDRVKVLRVLRHHHEVIDKVEHFTYVDDRLEGREIALDAGWRFGHAQWM